MCRSGAGCPTRTAGLLFTAFISVLVPGCPGYPCAGEQAVLEQELAVTPSLHLTFVPTESLNVLDKVSGSVRLEALNTCKGELEVAYEGVSQPVHPPARGAGASSVMAEGGQWAECR